VVAKYADMGVPISIGCMIIF